KAFLCVATARWIAEEGLSLDVCTGGELAVALRAEFPPERIGLHGNNKSTDELRRALEAGVGRIIVDSTEEIDRLAALTAELGVGGGFGIAYTTQDDPSSPDDLARGLRKIVDDECAAVGITVPRLSVEPGRAIAGPSTFTLYEVGTTKDVELDGGASRRYLS